MGRHQSKYPHQNVLRRIKRGLAGYVSYLAACDVNTVFSEYVLYEPILRILITQGYETTCEKECPGFPKNNKGGDKKRLDFEATHGVKGTFALEVKWATKKPIDVVNDHEKLVKYRQANPNAFCYLCVFGRKSHIETLRLNVKGFREFGDAVYAEFGQTRYSCRIFQLQ